MLKLFEEVKQSTIKRDSTVTGFDVGINDGVDAGKTIMHGHIYLIPRRDMADPRRGVRHLIPRKGYY